MNLPNKDGRYIARPNSWTVEEGGTNKLVTFVCEFELLHRFGSAWEPVHDLQITGYFYLTRKDGQMNEHAIRSLIESLGWDGRSLAALANSDWSNSEVQLTLAFEEYNGSNKIKVKFINPRDWEPKGITKDPQVIQSLEARYGAMFRASAPAATRPHTTPPASNKPANGQAVGDPVVQAARRKAWEAFQAKHPGKSADDISDQWREKVKATIPDRASTTFTAADWVKVQSAIEHPVDAPFGTEEVFQDEDIPF